MPTPNSNITSPEDDIMNKAMLRILWAKISTLFVRKEQSVNTEQAMAELSVEEPQFAPNTSTSQ